MIIMKSVCVRCTKMGKCDIMDKVVDFSKEMHVRTEGKVCVETVISKCEHFDSITGKPSISTYDDWEQGGQ